MRHFGSPPMRTDEDFFERFQAKRNDSEVMAEFPRLREILEIRPASRTANARDER